MFQVLDIQKIGMDMAKVVVFGFTGYAGSAITAELVARGHEVVGVARSEAASSEGVTAAAGSVSDEAFVRGVAAGASHIVVSLPAAPRADGDASLVDAIPLLTEVAVAEGARLGVVGGAGSLLVSEGGLLDTPEFPAEVKPEAIAHGEVLEALRAGDEALDWFYVSPAATFGSWNVGERTGGYRVGGDLLLADAEGDSSISGADYAIAFVDEIERGDHSRTRFSVAY
jgi:putative NADH-flavin reductase